MTISRRDRKVPVIFSSFNCFRKKEYYRNVWKTLTVARNTPRLIDKRWLKLSRWVGLFIIEYCFIIAIFCSSAEQFMYDNYAFMKMYVDVCSSFSILTDCVFCYFTECLIWSGFSLFYFAHRFVVR